MAVGESVLTKNRDNYMNNEKDTEKLVELFMSTGHAHHQAYIETDGVDPDWAIWYGNYLEKPISGLIDAEPSATEITEKLVLLDKEFSEKSRSDHWTVYYAIEFVNFRG